MAKRKTTHKRKRTSHKGMSEAPKRQHKRRTMMGDLMNPTIAKNAIKNTLIAGGSGFGARVINDVMPATWGKIPRVSIGLGMGFLLSALVNPSAGAGFAGGMTAVNVGLNLNEGEENKFAEESSLSDMPLYLNEQGSPFVIEEGSDGQAYQRYLNEGEVAMLSEDVKEQLRVAQEN